MEPREAEQLANELIGSAHVLVAAVLCVKNAILSETGARLTFSQMKILKLIQLGGSHSVGDVGAFLHVSDAAASKAVDRLVRQKLLRRSEARLDRRNSEIFLSAAGRKAVAQYDAARDRILGAVFANLDAREVRQTAAFLEKITRGIVSGRTKPEEMCLQCAIYLNQRCLVRDGAHPDCKYRRRRKAREAAGRKA
jgi:DNA-binding MarR family transcriptional regulator